MSIPTHIPAKEKSPLSPSARATPWVIDFRLILVDEDGVDPRHYRTQKVTRRNSDRLTPRQKKIQSIRNPPTKRVGQPIRSMNPKQIRVRARRAQSMLEADLEELYKHRPMETWDAEELARGRPRDKAGGWRGPKPEFVNRQFHEKIVKRFAEVVKMDMREQTVEALVVMKKVMMDDRVDARGRPITPSSTKLDAAKFLIEHVVGKPTQRTETDISIKLQAILGTAMLNPPNPDNYIDAVNSRGELTQGYIEAEVIDEGDEDDGES